VKQCFVPATAGARLYRPTLLVAVTAYYANARAQVDRRVESVLNVSISPDDLTIDWDAAHKLPIESGALAREATPGLAFAGVPALLTNAGKQRTWESSFKRWFRSNRPLRILHCAALKLYSEPGEAEGEFRARLQHAANENRDVNVAKLRKSYETKVARVESRLLTAKQALERESEQARGAKLDTALSVGTAVLGALLGRKRISVTSVNRGSTAIRKAGSASKQAGDVRRARERIAALEAQMQELADAFDSDIAALDAAFDAQTEPLTETLIKPKATDIEVLFLGIGWVPAAG
jgi:hypothetical protein